MSRYRELAARGDGWPRYFWELKEVTQELLVYWWMLTQAHIWAAETTNQQPPCWWRAPLLRIQVLPTPGPLWDSNTQHSLQGPKLSLRTWRAKY